MCKWTDRPGIIPEDSLVGETCDERGNILCGNGYSTLREMNILLDMLMEKTIFLEGITISSDRLQHNLNYIRNFEILKCFADEGDDIQIEVGDVIRIVGGGVT